MRAVALVGLILLPFLAIGTSVMVLKWLWCL